MLRAASIEGIHPTKTWFPGSTIHVDSAVTSRTTRMVDTDPRSRSGYEKDTPESSRHVKVLGTGRNGRVAGSVSSTLTRRNPFLICPFSVECPARDACHTAQPRRHLSPDRPMSITESRYQAQRRYQPRIGQHPQRGSFRLVPLDAVRCRAQQRSDDASAAGGSPDGASVAVDVHGGWFLPMASVGRLHRWSSPRA